MLLRHQNPGSLVVSDKGLLTGEEATFVADIPEPEVVVFPVVKEKDTGISVIICPGDGYAGLALTTGGYDCAEWMAAQGITGMALKYRLPHGKKNIPLDGMQAAIRFAHTYRHVL